MKTLIYTAAILFSVSTIAAAAAKTTYTFASQRKAGQIDRVTANLKVKGKTVFVDGAKSHTEAMDLVCDLEYDEKNLAVVGDAEGILRSLRNYDKVAVNAHVGSDEFKPSLRPERRLICAEANDQTAMLFSPKGTLSRTELDLLEIQANTLLWDHLLPDGAVAVNDRWTHSETLMAALLGLDEVAKTDVESCLHEVTDRVARFDIEGHVEGAVHGAPTKIELRGKYRFDLRTKRIDWLAMLLKEERDSSLVADGLEANSVLQVVVRQVAAAPALADEALRDLAPAIKSPPAAGLTYAAGDKGWEFDHDRRWFVFKDSPAAAVLRMLDRGETVGQCNVSSLPVRASDELVGLEEFQADIQRALGKNFEEFVEASESGNDSNCRVLRVVAEGQAADIPIRWTYYHVADPKGRQVAFVFTVEKSLLERFDNADQGLVQSLRFPAMPNVASKPTSSGSEKQ